jgi:two-component system nitrogen regulation response regulator GlnG
MIPLSHQESTLYHGYQRGEGRGPEVGGFPLDHPLPYEGRSRTMNNTAKTVLVADDDQAIRFVLEQALTRAGFEVNCFSDGHALLEEVSKGIGDLVITDIVMPKVSGLDLLKTLKSRYPHIPVIVITAQSTLLNAVNAFERGAFDYLPKPFDINTVVDLSRRALDRPQSVTRARARPVNMDRFGGIIGSSRAMQELFRTIGRLSNSEMTVLIHGESGTGKELVARAVHAYSPRRDGPFTAINMAAIPRELIESELFGHEKGAFTGAVNRHMGHFERAEGGTLFLDEIGDMPMEAQTRLLRVLQEATYTRIGGTEPMKSNVRIIAATHQNLPEAIVAGRFREDLFYRLNVIPLHTPALRTRPEDIPLLVEFFLSNAAKELNAQPKRISTAAMERLCAHPWLGNVRELENMVRRMMVLVPDDVIGVEHLQLPEARPGWRPIGEAVPGLYAPLPSGMPSVGNLHHGNFPGHPPLNGNADPLERRATVGEAVADELNRYFDSLNGIEPDGLYDLILHQVEEALITRVLRETRGNRVKASKMLGINRNTLRKKTQLLGLDAKK